ncbi:ATPase [Pseudonocardia petroleophila]|uniref:ATP-binding protein n=1 Tax=Pseudonocardia petroleophila TaxID=37331 RepID=A0A7G7MCF8_9PSEU|nr:ATP-binding protein [Pseudonocardia petroleophila]QNG50469.1 ATP-binding protein [Pseudonocardia petroleophila]
MTAPVPRSWGWAVPGGGRAGHVEPGNRFAGTTSQICGLFPFATPSGSDVRGVPIGRHLHTAEPIGLDPAQWLRTGLVSNTGVWVQGQPGIGKSSITKRMVTGLVGFGMRAVIPGDVKGEYTGLVHALGGSVWRLGRGLESLNPLDAGPLREALRAAPPEDRLRLTETLRARRLSLLEALITIVRRTEPDVTERRLLGAALDVVINADPDHEPVIPEILSVLRAGPAALATIAAVDEPAEYRRFTRTLTNTLGLLCEGAIRGIFDRPSSTRFNPDTPALSLDISALDDDEDEVVAAAMLCSWTWSAGLADAAGYGERRRNVVQVQDELWRALRVAPGLVERSDRITRLGRHRGVVSFQVTHSLDDLEALPTEADRAKARGMASRNGVLLLGGMADKELDGLRRLTSLTRGEAALITSWAAPPTWHSGRTHPGRGKYLIKSGQRLGLPVALTLTPTEIELHDTDRAFRVQGPTS